MTQRASVEWIKCTDPQCPVVKNRRRDEPVIGPHCHPLKFRPGLHLRPVESERDPAHILRMIATMARGDTFSRTHVASYAEEMAQLFDQDRAAK